MALSFGKMVFQERDLLLLRALLESRIMTSTHVAAFHFDGKREAAKKRLQKLKAAGLVGERRRRVSEPAVLFLTGKAFAVLEREGILAEYPSFDRDKRSRVSDLTVRHELEVLDVKAAFQAALRQVSNLRLEEFSTWPACYEFSITPLDFGREILVKPDGYIRVHETEANDGLSEHSFFLEVDRSTEVQDVLVRRSASYVEYQKSGAFAEWCGGNREKPQEYPFRVLIVLKTEERRNNLAERLVQSVPPILTRTWLSTFSEVIVNPFGAIWVRPKDYIDATKGTLFDPGRDRSAWGYRRQTEREIFIGGRIQKHRLFP